MLSDMWGRTLKRIVPTCDTAMGTFALLIERKGAHPVPMHLLSAASMAVGRYRARVAPCICLNPDVVQSLKVVECFRLQNVKADFSDGDINSAG